MPVHFEAFEARPAAEIESEFLRSHGVQKNDFVATSPEKLKCLTERIGVVEAIAQQDNQPAAFYSAGQLCKVCGERSFTDGAHLRQKLDDRLKVIGVGPGRYVVAQSMAKHCQTSGIRLPQYEPCEACRNSASISELRDWPI